MKIGVLALQGDFAEHIVMLRRLGVDTAEVRLPQRDAAAQSRRIPSLAVSQWPQFTASEASDSPAG